MRCSKCGADNRQGRKFCAECGAPLAATCAKCGAVNEPNEKFCGECGAALTEAARRSASEDTPISVSGGGERRHLTVLFCDLVGSTEIAAQLDPEEWRELVASYLRATAEAITRYGGHVAKYLGDGVMAYFGWPEAHENDAERAARAGLAIAEEVSKLNHQSTHPKIAVRVGIDSGAVVVGAGAGKDADVFGEAPNIAARVQSVAQPDTVLVTAATHRLISGLFVVEERGAQELKGVAKPVELYRVLRPTGVRGRLAAAQGLTRFVGREEELRLLLNRWERAREGEGQLVFVAGEAGIGKSRLVAEFHDRIRDTPHIWMESAGEQFSKNTPFHAVTEMLSQWLRLQGGADTGELLTRLERALASAGLKLDEAVPLVAELLQLPVGERYPVLALVPELKRRRLFAVLMGWIFGAARLQPVVLVVEDLHWLDPSTLELEKLMAEQGATAPVMLLFTARPEFHTQWPMRSHHTQITLNRLSARNVREMIALMAARNSLASESVEAVVQRTGGVPLFVEELTRAVLESGAVGSSAREIPVTLHDSLMARLDRLGAAKEVIQIGAAIGGEFSYELLHAVHPIAEQDLIEALRSATDAEVVYVRGIAADATYQFKHALIRDAAYEALLRSRRKELHRHVAHVVDEKFPVLKESHPEVLARHWSEAGESELALAEWLRAAKAAEARNAFTEALESYQQALDLLKQLRESPERDLRELELSQSIVLMLRLTRGYTAAETIQATQHVAALAEKSGNLAQLGNSALSRYLTALNSGDVRAAGVFADQGFELALREGNPARLGGAYAMEINAHYYRGDFVGAEEHFLAGLKYLVSDDPNFRRLVDAPVSAIAHASYCAWMLGLANVARERMGRAMAAADENNLYQLALSKYRGAILHVFLGEYRQAESLAERAVELSQTPYLRANSQCVLGYARAQQGSVVEGDRLIRDGIASLLESAAHAGMTCWKTCLATMQARGGAVIEALETIEDALQTNPDELYYRPESLRVRGELRLDRGQIEFAEADFHEAIALARSMGAKAWELRANTSLARLLAQQSRCDEASSMLADIYNSFTEGFDTADLKEAKALLDELNA